MKLIAQKPCSFKGENFYIGDEIPAEYVLDPKTQEKMGVIAIAGALTPAADPVRVPVSTIKVKVHAEEGDLPLELTVEGLQAVVDALTSKATDAEKIIQGMTDGDALILLHIADSRKSIKAAAEARAKELSPEAGTDGAQSPEAGRESVGEL